MALYFNLSVYKDSYDLMLSIFRLTSGLPREFKFTSGEKIKNEALELIICIYNASRHEKEMKARYIEQARTHLEIIRVLIRVLKDLNILGVVSLVKINIDIETISKQLGQWSKHTARV